MPILTEQQAIEIYRTKIVLMETIQSDKTLKNAHSTCSSSERADLAKLYGVTSRAIRDIWGRRSWQYATRHLWPQDKDESLHQITPKVWMK